MLELKLNCVTINTGLVTGDLQNTSFVSCLLLCEDIDFDIAHCAKRDTPLRYSRNLNIGSMSHRDDVFCFFNFCGLHLGPIQGGT